jgi:hypothetical protein
MKNLMIAAALFSPLFFGNSTLAQYYQPQYNPPTIVSNSSQPIVVPPTVIMPSDQNASKKSCRESMIDLFLFSIRHTSGDCTQ